MKNVNDMAKCCGCGVCVAGCQAGGVELRLNKDGYYIRKIKEDKCISCGKCVSVCPQTAMLEPLGQKALVAYCKNTADVIRSSSGGIAYAIAQFYVNKGYKIIGAAWSEDKTKVEHMVVESEDDLEKLRKSKYVQSYTPDAFRQIGSCDKAVVFGTPCQIAGSRNLYGKREGMILVDFDCMGPSGLGVWSKYLDYLQQRNSSQITDIQMRCKKKSWMMYGTRVDFAHGKVYYQDKFHDPFCIMYHMAHMIQETCLRDCPFLNASSADLRVGDAWGYTKGFDRKRIHDGLSLVTCQSVLGKQVLQDISGSIVAYPVRRKMVKRSKAVCNQNLWDCLRRSDTSIMDAVRLYNQVDIKERIYRNVSYLLSVNDSVYLTAKKLADSFR